MSTIKLSALTSIKSASGEITKNGKTVTGMLTLDTNDGEVRISLSEFDAIYRGMVNCWPTITPLKKKVIAGQKELTTKEKQAAREAAEATRQADIAKRKAERLAEAAKRLEERKANTENRIAKAKAAKEAKAAKAKAAKEAKVAKAKAAKAAKAEKAAAKKAKKTKGNKTAALESSAAALAA